MDTRPSTVYVQNIDGGRLPIPASADYRQSMAPPTPPAYHPTKRFAVEPTTPTHDTDGDADDGNEDKVGAFDENNRGTALEVETVGNPSSAVQNHHVEIEFCGPPATETHLVECDETKIYTDRGWAWAVLFAAFFCYMFADGWAYSLNTLTSSMRVTFNSTESVTSMIVSTQYGVPLIVSPLVCALANYVGVRTVGSLGGLLMFAYMITTSMSTSIYPAIAYSAVLAGCGLSMIYVSTMICVCFYFEKYRGLAIGIAVTGSGIGAIVFPKLIFRLIEVFGWQGMLLIMAGFCVVVCLLSAVFYRPVPKPSSIVDNKDNSSSIKEMENKTCKAKMLFMFKDIRNLMGNRQYLLFCVSSFILYLAASAPYEYLSPHSTENGSTEKQALNLLVYIGIARTVFQIIIGVISDNSSPGNISSIYAGIIIITGLFAMGITLSKSYIFMMLYSVMFGICNAAFYTQQMLIIAEIVEMDMLTTAFGFFQFVIGVAIQIGMPIIGLFKENSGDYNLSFNVIGVIFVIAGSILLPISSLKKNKNTLS